MIVAGYTIDRGRSYELDQNSPGTASVTLIDTTGELDPTTGAYPFDPMTPAAIALRNPVTGTDHTIFRGYVARLDYDLYQTEDYATVTVDCVDGMALLAAAEMIGAPNPSSPALRKWGEPLPAGRAGDVYFFPDSQTSAVAHRINKILDDADFPAGLREIFSGNVSLQETVYATRSPALSAIQDAADAEHPGVANFYFQGNGTRAGYATFHGRLARFRPQDANYHIATWKAGDLAAVAADSTRALIFELQYDRDMEKIINAATATPQNAADADLEGQYVENAASINTYGTHSVSFENLLTAGDAAGAGPLDATRKFATYYVSNYAQPRTRVNKITFKRVGPQDPYAARIWRVMCGVEISDIISLKTTHGGGGGFDENFYVEGIHYSASPLSNEYVDVELTLDVSPTAYYGTNPF